MVGLQRSKLQLENETKETKLPSSPAKTSEIEKPHSKAIYKKSNYHASSMLIPVPYIPILSGTIAHGKRKRTETMK